MRGRGGRVNDGLGRYDSLIMDARNILTGFVSWEAIYVQRDGNKAAHHLAKLAILEQVNKVWVDSYPIILSEIVNTEQIILENQ